MNALKTLKYKPLSLEEMTTINGGKKVWRYSHTEKIYIDCPDSARRLHPGTPCSSTTQVWEYVNNRGKVFGTEYRADLPVIP